MYFALQHVYELRNMKINRCLTAEERRCTCTEVATMLPSLSKGSTSTTLTTCSTPLLLVQLLVLCSACLIGGGIGLALGGEAVGLGLLANSRLSVVWLVQLSARLSTSPRLDILVEGKHVTLIPCGHGRCCYKAKPAVGGISLDTTSR